jgi:hypothetical protein
MEWKWTKGEYYERTRRNKKIDNQNNIDISEIEKSAYTTSLNHDENTWDILNQSIYNDGFRQSNKREDLDFRIADRDLIQQIGINPFMTQTNYIDDISIRDKFLKPINTTQGKTTSISENT